MATFEINFDATSPRSLRLFYNAYADNRRSSVFREYCSEKSGSFVSYEQSEILMGLYLRYAVTKMAAMEFQEHGQTGAALVLDRLCDEIYRDLPTWLRW